MLSTSNAASITSYISCFVCSRLWYTGMLCAFIHEKIDTKVVVSIFPKRWQENQELKSRHSYRGVQPRHST